MPRYQIFYNKLSLRVDVLPEGKAPPSNSTSIGNFNYEDASLESRDLAEDLGKCIQDQLLYVGVVDVATVTIHILDAVTGERYVAQEGTTPVTSLPQEDQTPVSADITAAQAATMDQEKETAPGNTDNPYKEPT